MKKILWRIKRQNRKAKLLVKNLKSAKLQRKVTKKLKKVNQKVLRERLPKEVKKLQRKAKQPQNKFQDKMLPSEKGFQ